MNIKEEIFENILNGSAPETEQLVLQALKAGVGAEELLRDALIPAMAEVGVRFERGDLYIPEMLISARAMKAGLAHLRPRLVEQDVKPAGKIILGTVKGDLHDIGKNLVGMMMEGAGFQVIDLGVDVSPDKFVQSVKDTGAELVGMSALLTTTMLSMEATIQALKQAGLYGKVKVIVGGAPITQGYADKIGAHGYASDASSASRKAMELLG